MYENSNYEWCEDWDAFDDEKSWLPKSLYWTNLYYKLYWQGTTKDKMELKRLYNFRKQDRQLNVALAILETLFNSADCYRYACTTFISNLNLKSSQDDFRRERQLSTTICQQKMNQTRKKIYGFDIEEYNNEVLALERECERHHAPINTNFVYQGDNLIPSHPNRILSLMQTVIKRGQQTVTRLVMNLNSNYMANKSINVYYRVHDKINGFYCLELFSDNKYWEYADEDKKQPKSVLIYDSHLYKGLLDYNKLQHYISDVADRIESNMKAEMFGEDVCNISLNPNRKTQKPRKQPRTQKRKEPDISKINQALGLEETEDLNGNIF